MRGRGLAAALAAVAALGGAFALAQVPPAAGTRLRDCPDCPEIVVLAPGRLLLGTEKSLRVPTEVPAETRPVEVRITRAFGIGRFEVTRGQYRRFALATGRAQQKVRCRTWVEARQGFADLEIAWDEPSVPAAKRDDHPATCIDWFDARAYADWLSAQTGQRYRLPSEVEWEYAARAGTRTLRHWGNDANAGCRFANSHDRSTARRYPLSWTVVDCDDGHADVAPVGSLAPNAFGLHDMLGNVWEWIEDCSSLTYVGRPTDQRAWTWEGGCRRRIQRGGGWITGPERSRSGFHGDGDAADRADFAGFRVARDLDAPAPATEVPATAAQPAPSASTLPRCTDCPVMIPLASGRFTLGSSADDYEHDPDSGETPPLEVSIRQPFAIARDEVTVREFAQFVAATGHRPALDCWRGEPQFPVTCITQADGLAYAAWLSSRTGLPFRMPSEAEWEYAARAGSRGARFWSGRDSHEGVSISRACEFGNVYDVSARALGLPWPHARCSDGRPGLAPVGAYAANPWGLRDLIGNARERVADCYTASYKGRPADERAWQWRDCRLHVVRGGSYLSRPRAARSAAREHVAIDATAAELRDVGFRVALDLSP